MGEKLPRQYPADEELGVALSKNWPIAARAVLAGRQRRIGHRRVPRLSASQAVHTSYFREAMAHCSLTSAHIRQLPCFPALWFHGRFWLTRSTRISRISRSIRWAEKTDGKREICDGRGGQDPWY